MADYKAMYLKMMNAAEEAIEILIKAQRECEELYMSADEPTLRVLIGTSNGKERVQTKNPHSLYLFIIYTSSVAGARHLPSKWKARSAVTRREAKTVSTALSTPG